MHDDDKFSYIHQSLNVINFRSSYSSFSSNVVSYLDRCGNSLDACIDF